MFIGILEQRLVHIRIYRHGRHDCTETLFLQRRKSVSTYLNWLRADGVVGCDTRLSRVDETTPQQASGRHVKVAAAVDVARTAETRHKQGGMIT